MILPKNSHKFANSIYLQMFRDVFGEFSEDGKRVSLDNFQRFLVKEQVMSFEYCENMLNPLQSDNL